MEITTEILLDSITARLGSVSIKNGGWLVFDPEVKLAKIMSDNILVGDGGYFAIGGKDCQFTGNAEVLLTGMGAVTHMYRKAAATLWVLA